MRLFCRARSTLAHLLFVSALAGLAACGGGDDGGTGPDDEDDDGSGTLLASGTPLAGRSGGEGSETLYRITVPSGATRLLVTTTGGTGDLDLYLRAGRAPTEASSDCQSGSGDNEESCDVEDPAAGTWYILLAGFEAYSGATLTATVTGGDGGDGDGDGDGYTLSVSPASPSLVRGGATMLTVTATRTGYTGAVALAAEDLPTGVTAGAATIAEGATSATLTLTASASAATGTSTITVRGEATDLADRTTTASLTVSASAGQSVTWRSASMGQGHACAVTTANVAYCWGARTSGAIGDGTQLSAPYDRPAAVGGGLQWAAVRAGANFTCGVTTGAQGYCWGENQHGKLGIGSEVSNVLTPEPIALGDAIAQIVPGISHACALTTGGDVYCMGSNSEDQISAASSAPYQFDAPTAAATGRTYSQLALSQATSCALASTGGAVWCWGFNNHGQLGMGSNADRHLPPVQVLGGPYTQVTGGYYHHCALTPDDEVYCWGANAAGEVGVSKAAGDFSLDPTPTPQLVGGGQDFVQVVAGYQATCALTAAGAAYCWGSNTEGQLGNGGTADRIATPQPVTGGLVFESLSPSTYKGFCGVTAAGATWCWGYNWSRQLGSEAVTATKSEVPVLVSNPL